MDILVCDDSGSRTGIGAGRGTTRKSRGNGGRMRGMETWRRPFGIVRVWVLQQVSALEWQWELCFQRASAATDCCHLGTYSCTRGCGIPVPGGRNLHRPHLLADSGLWLRNTII